MKVPGTLSRLSPLPPLSDHASKQKTGATAVVREFSASMAWISRIPVHKIPCWDKCILHAYYISLHGFGDTVDTTLSTKKNQIDYRYIYIYNIDHINIFKLESGQFALFIQTLTVKLQKGIATLALTSYLNEWMLGVSWQPSIGFETKLLNILRGCLFSCFCHLRVARNLGFHKHKLIRMFNQVRYHFVCLFPCSHLWIMLKARLFLPNSHIDPLYTITESILKPTKHGFSMLFRQNVIGCKPKTPTKQLRIIEICTPGKYISMH